MPRARLFQLACGLALSAGLPGCQHFERIGECRQVARLVNPVLASVDAERHEHPNEPRSYRFIAMQYDTLALGLTPLHPKTPRLGDLVREYQRVLHSAARDARTFADALDQKNDVRMKSIRATAARTTKQESGLASRMDAFCRSR